MWVSGASASVTLQLPLNGSTTIYGPFGPSPVTDEEKADPSFYTFAQMSLVALKALPPLPVPTPENNFQQGFFDFGFSAGAGPTPTSVLLAPFVVLSVAASSNPGPVYGSYYQSAYQNHLLNPQRLVALTGDNPSIGTFGTVATIFNTDWPDFVLSDYFAWSATLPDGFSVAAAVPEPSTWVMILIGFFFLLGARRYFPLNCLIA